MNIEETGSRNRPGDREEETIVPDQSSGADPRPGPPEEETIIRDIGRGRLDIGSEEETVIHPESDASSNTVGDKTVMFSVAPMRLGYLVEKTGPRASHVHRLGDQTRLGRTADNDIVVDDTRASRSHATIKQQDDGFVLYDLAATNGTWLLSDRGKDRIEAPHALEEGEIIQIGKAEFIFMEVGESALRDK